MTDTDKAAEITERQLCATRIGETFLRREVERRGNRGSCDYCGDTDSTLSIGEVADYVDTAFEQHYRRTPTEPSPFEYAMMKDGGYSWKREGQVAVSAISDAAEIAKKPADDIRGVLEERHYDIEMAQMGQESSFDEEACYEEKEADDIEYRDNWRFLEKNLKAEARFFSAAAEETLADIFTGLPELRSPSGEPIIVEAGPGAELTSLFRARVFQSGDDIGGGSQAT